MQTVALHALVRVLARLHITCKLHPPTHNMRTTTAATTVAAATPTLATATEATLAKAVARPRPASLAGGGKVSGKAKGRGKAKGHKK